MDPFRTSARREMPSPLTSTMLVVTSCLLTTCKDKKDIVGPEPVSVEVSPTSAELRVGQTAQLNAILRNTVNLHVTWTSQDTTIATVSADGLVRGVRPGEVKVTVAWKQDLAKTADCLIRVLEPVTLRIDSGATLIGVDDTVRLSLTGAGGALSNNSAFWRSSNEQVVSVSATGLITGKSPGSALVTARAVADTTARDSVVIDVSRVTIASIVNAETQVPVDTINPVPLSDGINVNIGIDHVPQGGGTRLVLNVARLAPDPAVADEVQVTCPDPPPGLKENAVALETLAREPIEIVCPVTTAAIDAATGTPRFADGPHTLKAVLFGPSSKVVGPSRRINFSQPPATVPSMVLAANGQNIFIFGDDLSPVGSVVMPDSVKLAELGTPCEIFVNCSTPALYATSGGTAAINGVFRLNTDPLSVVASHRLSEPVFNVAVHPSGNCVAVPLQGAGTVQMLNANLTPTSQVNFPGGFTTKVSFNPVFPVAYVVDGTRVRVLNTDVSNCTITNPGVDVTYANLRHVAIDPKGAFMYALTFNLFGNSSTLAVQPLANGLPTGAPVITALPAPAFQVAVHPTLDVIYTLQDAPNAAIRSLTLNRGTGAITVGAAFPAFGVDKIIFNDDATQLYYQHVGSPSLARICKIAVNSAGELVGGATCADQPNRSIDQDIIFVKP